MEEQLDTMRPAVDWNEAPHAVAIKQLRSHRDEVRIRVWGGDWCKDCKAVLPPFAAALEAAGIDPATVDHYPVEKEADGSKIGPLVEEYDITLIPTIVVEIAGDEVARFVESGELAPIDMIAAALASRERQAEA